MPTVYYEGEEIECEEGAILRDVLLAAGFAPYNSATQMANCGGNGACGTCACKVEGEASDVGRREKIRLSMPPLKDKDVRLSCQTRVQGDVTVRKAPGMWGQKELDGATPVRLTPPKDRDWPMLRATQANVGTTADADGHPDSGRQWQAATDGYVRDGPALLCEEELVTVVTDRGTVEAFDLEDGARQWSREVEPPENGEAVPGPVVSNGNTFAVGEDLHSFEAAGGRKRWDAEVPGDRPPGSPAIVGNVVCVPGNAEKLYAFDTVTGFDRWEIATSDPIASVNTPTASREAIHFGTTRGAVTTVDAETGERLWETDVDAPVEGPPAVDDDHVVVRTQDGIASLDIENGSGRWTYAPDGEATSGPAVDEGTAFIGTDAGEVIAVDAETGDEQWRSSVGDEIVRDPAVTNGTLYTVSGDGSLHVLSTEDGSETETYSPPGRVSCSPVVDDEAIYFATDLGVLHAESGG